jgi:hypothetical protein
VQDLAILLIKKITNMRELQDLPIISRDSKRQDWHHPKKRGDTLFNHSLIFVASMAFTVNSLLGTPMHKNELAERRNCRLLEGIKSAITNIQIPNRKKISKTFVDQF